MLWKCGGFVLLSDTLPFEEVSKRCVRNFQQSWERHGRLAGDVNDTLSHLQTSREQQVGKSNKWVSEFILTAPL